MCQDFEWIQFLRLAQVMAGDSPGEAITPDCEQRTIANRAYYAAYNLAKQYLVEVDATRFESERPTHKAVREWYFKRGRETGNTDLSQVARLLVRSYNERHAADYDAAGRSFATASVKVVEWAEQVVRKLRSIRAGGQAA